MRTFILAALIAVFTIPGVVFAGGDDSVAEMKTVRSAGIFMQIPPRWSAMCEESTPYFDVSPKFGVICTVTTTNNMFKVGVMPNGTDPKDIILLYFDHLSVLAGYDGEERRLKVDREEKGPWEVLAARYIYAADDWEDIFTSNYFAFAEADGRLNGYTFAIVGLYGQGSADEESLAAELQVLLDGIVASD